MGGQTTRAETKSNEPGFDCGLGVSGLDGCLINEGSDSDELDLCENFEVGLDERMGAEGEAFAIFLIGEDGDCGR
jgi:hypothetical protein